MAFSFIIKVILMIKKVKFPTKPAYLKTGFDLAKHGRREIKRG